MVKFSFRYKNKNISLDVEECRTILSRASGLMFKKKSPALLFIFNKPVKMAIHSFFCKPFIAIWFINDKIVEIKKVKPWKVHICPEKKFNKLLEIPFNNKNYSVVDDRKV
jgi:uncharacterized membrane protein (UPF0127 family)